MLRIDQITFVNLIEQLTELVFNGKQIVNRFKITVQGMDHGMGAKAFHIKDPGPLQI